MSDDEVTGSTPEASAQVDPRLVDKLEHAITRLERARPYAKLSCQGGVLELSRRIMAAPGGLDLLYRLAPRLDSAGLFTGTDWDQPGALLPSLVRSTLEQADRQTVVLECLSQLRFLAIANDVHGHPGIAPEQASHFLTQVLALNLNRLFDIGGGEATRVRDDGMAPAIEAFFHFLADHVRFEDILGSLVEEIWRILAQRPIQVGAVKTMVTQIAITIANRGQEIGEARLGADRLISALFGPTRGCTDDPGLAVYAERLAGMDRAGLEQEAHGFARAMHDVGLVSDYHPAFLRFLLANDHPTLLATALGLSSTGLDVLRSYQSLIHRLIEEAIHPQTAQAVYGLAMMLERGLLYTPSIAPALWRQWGLPLSPAVAEALGIAFGYELPPRVHLLAGVIALLGQPLGIGQGNNPTCQSARALSMWSFSDPDYLLHLVAQAAQFDSIRMHFEGQAVDSSQVPAGSMFMRPLDTDPVSALLVPHLDRVYYEMGRICIGRGEDPHRWINPEFHGWWVGRKFMIAVDVASGGLKDYDRFVAQFYGGYHPYYNGNQPLIHPQPAGIAITDSNAQFVGWHAITIQRVAIDQDNRMRVYFFNPNNDSGQDWGHGVKVSTQDHGERFGESSLPFEELASRLYIYHDDPVLRTEEVVVPEEDLAAVRNMALASWAEGRLPEAGSQAAAPGPALG